MHFKDQATAPAHTRWLMALGLATAVLSSSPADARLLHGRIQAENPTHAPAVLPEFGDPAFTPAPEALGTGPEDWLAATFVLPPGERPLRAQARVLGTGQQLATDCIGAGADRGWQLGLVRVARPPAGTEPVAIEVELETGPGAALPVARRRLDPVQQERSRADLRLRVANPEDLRDPAFAPRIAVPDAQKTQRSRQRGFDPTADPSLDGSGIRYLVVTTEALAPAFAPLVEWKTRRGVPAAVRTLEWIESRTRQGVDRAETLRNFLIEAYTLWGVEWVLLGGDTGIVPVRYAWTTALGPEAVPTDLYYACLDGTWNGDGDDRWAEGSQTLDPSEADIFPELGVARAPVNDVTQAQVFVTRVLDYESPLHDDYQHRFSFLTEVLVPANWDSGAAFSYDGAPSAEQMINQSLPTTFDVQRFYDTWWLYPPAQKLSKAAAAAAMNAGSGYINHLGHGFRYTMSCGDASFVNADADALANGDRRFILLLMNCAAVAFDYNCLAERFVLNAGGGAVGVVGAARSVGANYVTIYNRAFYRQLFEHGHVHLAEALNAARLERAVFAQLESGDRQIQMALNVLGDPEMPLFTAPVRRVTMSYESPPAVAPDTLAVLVNADSLPVSGARLCAMKDGEVYAVTSTDSAGAAWFAIEPQTTGPLYVTVSGANVATHTDTLQVAPAAGPVLALGAVTVDDDSLGASDGDGDGELDAGETLELAVTIDNLGAAPADSIVGTLTSPDPGFVVLQGALEIGDVAAAESGVGVAPLVVQIAPGVADGRAVDLQLELHDLSGVSWQERLHLVACAPRPEVTRLVVTPPDSAGSTAITRLDIEIKNYGSGKQPPLLARVLPPDSTVVVVRDSMQFATLGQLTSGMGAPALEIAPADTSLVLAPVRVRFEDARGRSFELDVDLAPPPTPGLPTADLSAGAGIVQLAWPVSSAPDHLGYHVFRAPAGGGAFERITTDLVRHAQYSDTGVQPASAYSYTVVDVDSSLQWSTPSPELGVSTTATPFTGYPLEMTDPTASSPAIGDLDGDGDMEIVVGDKGVYAWHNDGLELRDGDNSPPTTGLFSPATGTMLSSVALAAIDNLPGLEIIAASWLTNSIYVWNAQGQLMPGWPVQPMSGGNAGYWSSPCAADLDGDGSVEIVAVSKDGWLYAWHADGTPLLLGTNGAVRQVGAWTQTTPAIADLDGDGHLEIVVSGSLGQVFVLRDDGSDFPGWPYTLFALGKGSPAIGDVNGGGDLEIVVTSESDHMYVFRTDGTVLPGWPKIVQGDSPDFGPSPALGDLDGDGRLEIIHCAVDSPFPQTKLQVFDADGNLLFQKSLELNAQSSPILADLDGDGGIDIVHGGEAGTLHAWNFAGEELAGFPIPIGDWIRGTPAYCDLDLDGFGDLVLAGWDGRVYAWKMTGRYRPDRAPWPTFHGNVARTGFVAATYPTTTDEAPSYSQLVATWSPNPFNPAVTLRLGVPAGDGARQSSGGAVAVDVSIYDPRGRLVRALHPGPLQPGTHTLVWDGRDGRGQALGSGVYFYEVRSGTDRIAGKITLVR